MADRQWFAEGVQVYETGTEEWFAEGVQVAEDQPDAVGGLDISIAAYHYNHHLRSMQ